MPSLRGRGSIAAVIAVLLIFPAFCRSDVITLDNGLVYQGLTDRDFTIVSIFDGVKRIVLRDTKIANIDEKDTTPRYEAFPIHQPLTVHAGEMPSAVLKIKAAPWDDKGRREFEYVGPRSSHPIRMTQAINGLGPKTVQIRGVDGFWKSQLATSQVGKDVVLAILGKVDQSLQSERLKVGSFLIQAEWYPEALAELDRIKADFPELKDRVDLVKKSVWELQARQELTEIEVRRKAQQPKEVLRRLREFPSEDGVPASLLVEVREQLRRDEMQAEADRALANQVREAAEALTKEQRAEVQSRLVEMLQALAEAPDAVRQRFAAFQTASGDARPEARFALALSAWIVGQEHATESLETALALSRARDAVASYLRSPEKEDRVKALDNLRVLEIPDATTSTSGTIDLETLTSIARLMPPPLRDSLEETPQQRRRLRVRDDTNPDPTEYTVLLPPEYNPWRRYPVVIALHAGDGPERATVWWAEEAARRGYILVAPEYNVRDSRGDLIRDYRGTPSEHAAVELALRDARRRFSIDSNRVYLGGQLLGGNMAWDFGLSHPDLFAGVAVVNGYPSIYNWATKDNAEYVPMYVVMGELAPAEPEVIFPFGRSLISKNYDMTYVEYYRRGLENLPEEASNIFDWMDRHVRNPTPKEFETSAARTCDDRFFGVVIREYDPRRMTSPEAANPTGKNAHPSALAKNLHPATISMKSKGLANILDLDVSGVRHIDVWISPEQIDFSKRFEVRINGRAYFKDTAKPDMEAFLEDLRIRGDRQQVYWMRVSV